MGLHWKNAVLTLRPVAALAAVSGCGGINASRGVSPATFLLPGLMKAAPPASSPGTNTVLSEPAALLASH